MSFSGEQKLDLIGQPPKSGCCKLALMQGILGARATVSGKNIEISVEMRAVADFIASIAFEIYSKEAEVKTSSIGGRRHLVSFVSPSAAKFVTAFKDGVQPLFDKCALCQSYFLRGAFLASGRMSDPAKQFSLEFAMSGGEGTFITLFKELGLTPRLSQKKNESVIYFRKSTYIEDFFVLAAMNNTAFAVMNEKITNEIKNNVNRITNCTTSNIGKAVSASSNQIALIEELMEKNLISQLPDELEQTARLRLMHRDMSLSQLSAVTSPRISKPGLSHRLKKITQLAMSLLGYEE